MFVIPKVTLRVKVGIYIIQHHLDTLKYLCIHSILACLKLNHNHLVCAIDSLLLIKVLLYFKTVCYSKHSLPNSACQNSCCVISGKDACFVPSATHALCFRILRLHSPRLLPPGGYLPRLRPTHTPADLGITPHISKNG